MKHDKVDAPLCPICRHRLSVKSSFCQTSYDNYKPVIVRCCSHNHVIQKDKVTVSERVKKRI